MAAQTAPALDPFDRWAAARDVEEDRSVSARYVSRDIIGYQQLDQYGSWESDPSYGDVWVPRVTVPDWAPYRIGHWATVAPWGWTWIDDAPWGFAPFHYGRWTQLGTRWCWVPGARNVRPVYAPALVAFVGGSVGGVNFNISVGGATRPGVAWFPLAPGEAWHPWFRANPTYINNVNSTLIVHNVTNITNVTNVYRYQHQPMAVTAMTADAFTQGQHVRGNTQPMTAAELQGARVATPPAPTRDPRSIFGASRVTQAHPAPPAAALDRRVVSNQAINRRRAGTQSAREALPPLQERPQSPANMVALQHGFAAPGSDGPATPALPQVRVPLTSAPPAPREPLARSQPPHNEAIPPPRRQASAEQPQQVLPHQPGAQQQGPRQPDQLRREQVQNEQADHATQTQSQKAQESQRAQMQIRRAAQKSQRAQLGQQRQQTPEKDQAQSARPVQEKRGALTPEYRAKQKSAVKEKQPHHEEQRPEERN